MKKGMSYEFIIEATEFPGEGIAFAEGKKVYVKNAYPGQKVLARVHKNRKDHAEARVVEVVERAQYEIQPPCVHFDYCGGCTQQFVPYGKQLQFKEEQVLELFKKHGFEGFEYLGIEGSPEDFEYRNKMEFTFGDFEKGGELTLGMHMPGRSFGITNTEHCILVDEDIRKVHNTVVSYFRKAGLPHYRILQHTGYLRNLVVRKAKKTDEILVNIVTTSQYDVGLDSLKDELLNIELAGKLKGIIHTINDSLSEVVAADRIKILYGEDYITEELLGLKFKITPFSFFQTNSLGAERLYSIVREFMGEASDKVVFDLYCGTGTIGQIAAGKAKKVVGIELIEEAVESAKENAKLNGLNNCEFISGDVAKVIQTVTDKPDIIILDPPRSGVHPTALDYVIKFNAPTIIYVSCNPKTLMTDLKVLRDRGYKIKKLKIKDMFPQTAHVECVALIEKK
ncbi:23S rRNA (uracil(1939)-C(5))-methyltransferase RlmD [Clostridium thermarum]|uniref:23S rRNA (uracil(1939)-C(5))-methyltransferase RlmD n=1 Tax=Clostridium thermarum TaxID=1716543 RepID=UPI0013D00FD1|nr:23S rRNA (uracil(1939)-C(5))-methyltransferase RlmD [Clostridium thermarum]